MTLQAEVSSLDNIPEHLRSEYVERDGRFYLQVEGVKPQADFDRFEAALRKRVDETREKLDSANANNEKLAKQLADMQVEIDRVKRGGGGNPDADKLADLEREMKALKQANATLETERERAVTAGKQLTRDTALAQAIAASSPLPNQADGIADRISRYLEVASDGSVVTKDGCEFGINLTPSELVAKVKADPRFAVHWPGSRSGGAAGGDGGGGSDNSADNPWTHAKWNKTAQAQIIQADETKAKRLAAAAGVDIYDTLGQAQRKWAKSA